LGVLVQSNLLLNCLTIHIRLLLKSDILMILEAKTDN